jgi:ketosteroid isomerase-like protein
MATATTTRRDVGQADRELDDLIRAGRALEGLELFYADDVVMQENTAEPTRGKDANRRREEEFFAGVESVNRVEVHAAAAGDDVSFSEWTFDVNLKSGQRLVLNQVSVRRWKDGRIVHERFYYGA